MRIRTIIAAVLISVSVGEVRPDENSYFAARRDALMRKIDGAVAVLRGASDTRAYLPFRQNNDFYYLTGVESPGAFLILDAGSKEVVLFLPPRQPVIEQWEGPRLSAGEEASRATEISRVLEVEKFEEELTRRSRGAARVYTPLQAEETAAVSRDRAGQHDFLQESSPWDGRLSRERAFESNLRKKLGAGVPIRDLSPILDGMRRVKDEQELERMREAGRIGVAGIKEAMRSTRPGVFEYQLAAAAEFVFRWEGAQGPGYHPIVGSGPYSCVLHYSANLRKTETGDIVVMDFGPDYKYYQCDITRSFPVSGKFSEEQRKVYQVVLQAQKAALAQVRPGATMREINAAARSVIDRAGLGKYWLHGVTHYIGMATHDVGGPEPLVPGVALTVEPGVYIPEKNLGVRIEDTVVVTREGFEVLSRDLPKEISEIEKLMAEPALFLRRP